VIGEGVARVERGKKKEGGGYVEEGGFSFFLSLKHV